MFKKDYYCSFYLMYYESIDGLRIYYKKRTGNGQPVVFLHGLACSSESWVNQSKALRGKPQLFIDFRGHGRSSKPRGDFYKLDMMLSDVKGVMRQEGITDFSVIGFSLGGYVAALLNAKKKVLINPVISKESVKKSFIIKAWVAKHTPRLVLKSFKRGRTLSDYHGLLSDYA